MPIVLHIRLPERDEQRFELGDGIEISVGRGADVGLRLEHPTVSARHARLRCRDGTLQVRDEASRFGTQIGELPIPPGAWTDVGPADTVWIGDVAIGTAPAPPAQTAHEVDPDLWSVAGELDPPSAPPAPQAEVAPAATPPADDRADAEAVAPPPAVHAIGGAAVARRLLGACLLLVGIAALIWLWSPSGA